jgi:hypothetical protein
MAKSILFIGNSYTFYNDMPTAIFAPMAEAAGLPLEVTAVTKGGWKLSRFADPADEGGALLAAELAKGKKYDYVVLQDHSLRTIKNPDKFFAGVAACRDLLADRAGEFILYVTWGRKIGSPQLEELGLTTAEMAERISAAYGEAAARYGMKLAEVGRAFLAESEAHPDVELYNADLTHPSPAGSEIVARTILKAIMD